MEASMRQTTYEIHLRGDLPPGLLEGFDGATLVEAGGETVLLTPDMDQASLHRLVTRLRDLGVELLELRRAAVPSPGSRPESP
jgi:hypothetical protein